MADSLTDLRQLSSGDVVGVDFILQAPTMEYGNLERLVYSLPNPKPGRLLNLGWPSFGYCIERLIQQINNVGRRVDVDACFGINEAGLVMATFLASAQFGRCPIGYLKCNTSREFITLDQVSAYPHLPEAPAIVLCDFEVKHADVVGFVTREIRNRYPGAEIYFAVFGAMTKERDLAVSSFDDLVGARNTACHHGHHRDRRGTPRLIEAALSGDHRNRVNNRHADNFLSDFDILLHERYRELFAKALPSFVYASEEADPQIIGNDPDPDLCVLVDPLDTSEMAVRALNGYTHVMLYSRQLARPIAAVVGDIFHHLRLYVAIRDDIGQDRASLITADGEQHRLQVGAETALNEALVTNFLMKPDRFRYLAKQTSLIDALQTPANNGATMGRIGVDFGSVSLCHVAAGFTDTTLEVLKGFAVWDLAPGHYILQAAGGAVIDLEGNTLPLDYGFGTLADIGHAMDRRQKFVAASSNTLAQAIAAKVRED